jgi:hypothetical protein
MIEVRTIAHALLVGVLVRCGSSASDAGTTTPGTDGGSSDGASQATPDSSDSPADRGSPSGDGANDAMQESSGPHTDGSSPDAEAPIDGPQDSTDPGEAGSAPCTVVSDCRTFSNYCGGCFCDASLG